MRRTSGLPVSDAKEGGAKAKRIAALRRVVEGLQSPSADLGPDPASDGRGACLAAGLPGPGLVGGVLNEVIATPDDRPAAFGFLFASTAAALQAREGPAVFVATQRALDFGRPYGHGLRQLGIDVGRLILVETNTDKDALWAIEDTLRSEARPAMVAAAIEKGLDLTQGRRLNLAAAIHRTPLMVLRGSKSLETSAAAARWRITYAPAALDRFDSFASWRWHATLERCRNGRTGAWTVEWDAAACRFRPVPEKTASGPKRKVHNRP